MDTCVNKSSKILRIRRCLWRRLKVTLFLHLSQQEKIQKHLADLVTSYSTQISGITLDL